jgi:hypothetical protein
MDGPSGVIALVLIETAAGGTALLWLGGVWGAVRRGFFVLTESVTLGCALLATLAAAGAADPASGPARLAVLLAAAASVLVGLSLAALVLRLDGPGRWFGLLAIPAAAAALVAFGQVAGPSLAPAMLQILAGAAFMGAVTDGLLLGHWYLVDRRLSREPINRYTLLLIVAVVLEAAAVGLLGFRGQTTGPAPGFSPFLGIAGLATWLALGMVACTALIALLIRAALRGTRARAVQAATGFFYLAVITAFTAELAAKVRFLE